MPPIFQQRDRLRNAVVAFSLDRQGSSGPRIIHIEVPSFVGVGVTSPNGRFVLGWAEDSGPQSDSPLPGNFVVLDGGRIACYGQVRRPSDGKVADNGTFALSDTPMTERTESTLFVYSVSGEIVIRQDLQAILHCIGLSPDGRYAACQTHFADDENEDSCAVCIFDVESRSLLAKFQPEPGRAEPWAESLSFDLQRRHLLLNHSDGEIQRYTFDGLPEGS